MNRFTKYILIFSLALVTGCSAHRMPERESAEKHLHYVPWENPTPHPDRIAVTWKGDPASSFSVTWRTDTTVTEARAEIAIATPAPKFNRNAESYQAKTEVLDTRKVEGEHVKAHYHSVSFTGLQSDTIYAYRVGAGENWSEWFHTRTANMEPEPFSYIYFGDAQNGVHSHWSRAIRAAYTKAPDARFMVHAGDLINRAHRNVEWGEWFHAGGWIHGMLPGVPTPGNHEYDEYTEEEDTRHLSIHWRPQFTLPESDIEGLDETVYSLDYQGLRIIVLNSNTRQEEQVDWLEDQLENNPNRWTVATFHHPIFSSSEGRENPRLREAWQPVLEKYQVDLVMQGHDHTYGRGRTVNVPQGVNLRDPVAGTVYVNSVSGAKMYSVKEDRWEGYDGVDMERAAENTQLFQVVKVEQDTLRYRAYTATGELYDAFNLVKQDGEPNRFVELTSKLKAERTHENTIPYRD